MCSRPFRPAADGPVEFGCGKCIPCKVNRRWLWTGRLTLESVCWPVEFQQWPTLTYDDAHLPEDGVSVRDVQLFIKRLRKRMHPLPLRFFAVGEYGGKFGRPHYHVALFGCGRIERVRECWVDSEGKPIGYVHPGEVTIDSIQYMCAHTTKDLSFGKPREDGRNPGFQRMSLKPGIGAYALDQVVEWLTTEVGSKWLAENGDVNQVFHAGGRFFPFGKYLTGKLRERLGRPKTMPEPMRQAFVEKARAEGKDARGHRRVKDGYKATQMRHRALRGNRL